VTANYQLAHYTLAVNSSGISGVSITSSSGHSGTTNYTRSVDSGTSISLTAPAVVGSYAFTGWSGAVVSSHATISFAMNGDRTVTANYQLVQYTLAVNSAGISGVSITSSSGHGGTTNYTRAVDSGTAVSLTAPSEIGDYAFVGWSGAVVSSNATISFAMAGDRTVTANYELYYRLTVSSSGVLSLPISSSTGHAGTTTYTQLLPPGTAVSLTAPATRGSNYFTGWSGSIFNSNTTLSFSMTAVPDLGGNKYLTANYAPSPSFSFTAGAQGWTMEGAWTQDSLGNVNGPLANAFSFSWNDATNYPGLPFSDPADGEGSLRMSTASGHGINDPSAVWWIMSLRSADLSGSTGWQVADGYEVRVYDSLGTGVTTLYANLYVEVFDHDLGALRTYYSGPAQPLNRSSWTSLYYNPPWIHDCSGPCPTNYTVQAVIVNIWGEMSGSYSGSLFLDNVRALYQ
jgi:hypothetical protein